METKLTLRLDEELINKAKFVAKSKGSSLSKIVADYFKAILTGPQKEIIKSPILSEITGILHPKLSNEKLLQNYKKHLEEKYL
jgi:hypothetical protein